MLTLGCRSAPSGPTTGGEFYDLTSKQVTRLERRAAAGDRSAAVRLFEYYGIARRDQFTANDYHKPTDVIKPDWDLAGGVQDVGLLYTVGRRLADGSEMPSFYSTSEFRKLQDARLKTGGK